MTRSDSISGERSASVGGAFAQRGGAFRLFAFGVALFVTGCAGDGGDPGDLALADGQALYEENCMMCHGPDGTGNGQLASTLPVQPPSLMEHLGHHTEAQLTQLIQDGVPPAMPPSPLTDEQVGQVVDYLWTLVPESEVAALREMQRQMETMGDSAMGSMPGMPGMHSMPGMGTGSDSTHMQHDMEGMSGAAAPPAGQ